MYMGLSFFLYMSLLLYSRSWFSSPLILFDNLSHLPLLMGIALPGLTNLFGLSSFSLSLHMYQSTGLLLNLYPQLRPGSWL